MPEKIRRIVTSAALAAILVVGALPAAAQSSKTRSVKGQVDGSRLIELFGEDAIRVEVNIPPSLLAALSGEDSDLKQVTQGLEKLHALILDLGGTAPAAVDRARTTLRDLESRLTSEGWERLALVKDKDAEVRVLLLYEGSVVRGFVALVIDLDPAEPSLIFVNFAGTIDLAALRSVAESLDVPGLDRIDLEHLEGR